MSTPMRPSAELLRIGALKPRQLEALMLRGGTPDRDALPGREYIGMNLGPAARLLGIRKFIKGFYSPAGGQTFGYNVRARQNRPVEPWAARLSDGIAKRFGFYL